jgi:hypothetical protein
MACKDARESKMTPPSLSISGSAAAQYLAAAFRIGSSKACRFLDQQQHSSWLSISKTASAKLLAANF